MKASELIERLQHLVKQHGDHEVKMDTDIIGPYDIGDVDLDVDDSGFMLWKAEWEAE